MISEGSNYGKGRSLQIALIALTSLVYIVTIVFNQGSSGALSKKFLDSVFDGRKTGDVANKVFSVQILPAGWAFAIWGLIYIWQTLWLIYTWTLICRPKAAVLGLWFYVSFIASCVFNVSWLIVWAHLEEIWALVMLLLATLMLYSAQYFSYVQVAKDEDYLVANYPKDLICLRALVLNGLSFYSAWTTIATLVNLSIVLKYSADTSDTVASCVALAILLIVAVVWFGLQNFFWSRYFKYTFTTWPVVIWALSAVINKNWNSSNASSILSVIVLCIAILFYIIRVILGVRKLKQNSFQHV